MTLLTKIVIAIVMLAIFGITILIARNAEKREYNNGVCRRCGSRLRYFDSCGCGDRGYRCSDCGHIVWISYNVDGKRKCGNCR